MSVSSAALDSICSESLRSDCIGLFTSLKLTISRTSKYLASFERISECEEKICMKILMWYESIIGDGHAQVTNKLFEALKAQGIPDGEPLELAVISSTLDRVPDLDFAGARCYEMPGSYIAE